MKKISIFVMNNKKMKNLFTLIIVIFILLSCSSKKSVQLSDGSRITEKKYESIIDNSFEQGLSEVTENDVKLLENTNVDVEFIIIDSIFIDALPKNRFLVLDLRNNLTYEQTLPIGSEFWDYNTVGVVQILDTLEYHITK
jgi:hypothetical protein